MHRQAPWNPNTITTITPMIIRTGMTNHMGIPTIMITTTAMIITTIPIPMRITHTARKA